MWHLHHFNHRTNTFVSLPVTFSLTREQDRKMLELSLGQQLILEPQSEVRLMDKFSFLALWFREKEECDRPIAGEHPLFHLIKDEIHHPTRPNPDALL